jgi:hypothetical protein
MVKLRRLFFAILIFAVAPAIFHSAAQQPNSQPAKSSPPDPIAALLDLPAPLPQSAYDYADPWEQEKKPPIPGDDAPMELLLKYWTRSAQSFPNRPEPGEKIRRRFLEYVEENPDLLPKLLWLLPDTPDAHDRIKALLDRKQSEASEQMKTLLNAKPPLAIFSGQEVVTVRVAPEHAEEFLWHMHARDWLMRRSTYFRNELVERATQMREIIIFNAGGENRHDGPLETLARVDWEKAKPILDADVVSGSTDRAAMSLTIQYKLAVETGNAAQADLLRERLLQIAADKQVANYSRNKASEALLRTDWPGRDQFFLALFKDESLLDNDNTRFPPNALQSRLNAEPDKWIPVVAQMVGHPNRKLHDAAVTLLFHVNLPRKDALLPLLPWLTDPNWTSNKNSFLRERLIQKLMEVQIPEAVPYLIRILEGDEYGLPEWAARALVKYPAVQAGPALRKAAQRAAPAWKGFFSEALIKCGALKDEEKLAYLELYASKITRVSADDGLDYGFVGGDFDSFDWRIGSDLSKDERASMHLVPVLLDRIKALQQTNPLLAENLLLVVQRWTSAAMFQNIVARLGEGLANQFAIGQALRHREKMRVSVSGELQALIGRGGRAAGIAAALLGDQSAETEILRGKDREAQTALLACARLLREPFPVETVGELYTVKDETLRKAVDRYLESENSAEARQLVLAQHPNEALILGAHRVFDPRPAGELFKWEERLREEVKRPNGSEEIFALAMDVQASRSLVIRVRRGKAIIVKSKDNSRDEYRQLADDELAEVRELFEAADFDNLSSLIQVPAKNSYSHIATEDNDFVHLTIKGGRRVFTHTISSNKEKTVYRSLRNLFSRLEKSDGYKLRYKLEDRIEGLEVLVADDGKFIKTVCQQGRETRVLIGRKFGDDESQWFGLAETGIGNRAAEPLACPVLKSLEELGKQIGGSPESRRAAWQLRGNRETIQFGYRSGDPEYRSGMWTVSPGKEPEMISELNLSWPLVIGSKWVVGSQTGEKHLQTPLRFDLRTRRSAKIPIPPADYIQAVAEIPAPGKILIACHEDHYLSPTKTDFYLLDPATGANQLIKGEFRPLQQQTFRPLQPVDGSAEYWAAIPDEKSNQTQVGLYDVRKFAFTSLLELPEIKFDSMQMWADEPAGKLYIAYNGHLLRLPLPQRT